MPEFSSPFGGDDIDRKLSQEEVIRAVRFAIAAEYEAIQIYRQIASAVDDDRVKEVMNDVAEEEIVHAGEFLKLLKELFPEETDFYAEGEEEVKELLS